MRMISMGGGFTECFAPTNSFEGYGGLAIASQYIAPTHLPVVGFYANMERFQELVPLLPHLCPPSVPGGVGVCGVYSESP